MPENLPFHCLRFYGRKPQSFTKRFLRKPLIAQHLKTIWLLMRNGSQDGGKVLTERKVFSIWQSVCKKCLLFHSYVPEISLQLKHLQVLFQSFLLVSIFFKEGQQKSFCAKNVHTEICKHIQTSCLPESGHSIKSSNLFCNSNIVELIYCQH